MKPLAWLLLTQQAHIKTGPRGPDATGTTPSCYGLSSRSSEDGLGHFRSAVTDSGVRRQRVLARTQTEASLHLIPIILAQG